MTLDTTYDPVLSRVQITGTSYIIPNPYFEVDATGWTINGTATLVRSTVQFHQGAAAGLITPDGVTTTLNMESSRGTGVLPGAVWRVRAWVRNAATRSVDIRINWFTAADVFISSTSATTAVTLNTWTELQHSGTAPGTAAKASMSILMGSTPPVGHTMYVDEAILEPSPTLVERSVDQVTWVTVRGGVFDPADGAVALDDYEFAADVLNYYRVAGGTDTVTPTLGGVWLKSIARPFLNRQVTVQHVGEIGRPSRTGTFPVVGRSFPVAVTDVRGSKQFTLGVITYSQDEATNLDLLLASGDILFCHAPATGRLSKTPTGYMAVGDTVELLLPTVALTHRVFALPCTQVAAPAADVVGALGTCQTVLNTYATCSAVIAAHPTCADLLTLVGSADDVIVP